MLSVPAAQADSCPGAGPCVAVHLPGGTVEIVSATQIGQDADVHNTQYETRAVAGRDPQDEPYVNDGLSVHHLLEVLTPPYSPAAVGFVETSRPDGSWSTLTTSDVADPSDFAGQLLPVVRVDGSVVEYVRPLRSGSSDTNARDLLRASRIDLYVHAGSLLQVTTTADDTSPAVGQTVTFTAHANSASPVSYSWDFADGGAATGPSVTHAFTAQGPYDVLVSASTVDDSAGRSDPLRVTVGPAARPTPTPERASAGPTAAPGPSGAPGGNTATGAPSGGRARGGTPAPSTSGGGVAGPTGPSSSPVATALSSPGPAPRQSSTPSPRPSPRTQGVSGYLIGARTLDPATGSTVPQALSAASTRDASHRPWRGLVGGLTVVVLLSAGATRELRRR